jgi:tetratricopeptide (TPR) repeat protein
MSNYPVVATTHFFATERGRGFNRLMMEQPEVSGPTATPIVSLRIALSEEARASLEEVQVAQEAARQRARRQTRQARLLFAISAAAIALLVAELAPRVSRWRHARRPAPIAALPPASSPPPAPPATAAPAEAPIAQASAAATSPQAESGERAPTAGCDVASVRSAAWRVSPEACARAFEGDPTNAALALAVAQAEHARGHLTEAAQWAKRALALDPKAAEAYVLIARADMEHGRREDAGAAYRHYLELAPRGWHHTEARRALR